MRSCLWGWGRVGIWMVLGSCWFILIWKRTLMLIQHLWLRTRPTSSNLKLTEHRNVVYLLDDLPRYLLPSSHSLAARVSRFLQAIYICLLYMYASIDTWWLALPLIILYILTYTYLHIYIHLYILENTNISVLANTHAQKHTNTRMHIHARKHDHTQAHTKP